MDSNMDNSKTQEQQGHVAGESAAASSAESAASAQKTRRRPLSERLIALEEQKKRLAKRAAALCKESRKERNGQLIAWGLTIEAHYKAGPDAARKAIRDSTKNFLKDDRNLARALSGFARLDAELAEAHPADENPSTGESHS